MMSPGFDRRSKIGVLFVHTPPDVAFDFYRSREVSGSISIFDFLRVRDDPVEAEVREMIGQADAVLYNWNGRTEYQDAICDLMNEVYR
jgi:hypothetical protein